MPNIGRLRYLEALPPATTSSTPVRRGAAGSSRGTLVLVHGFPLSAQMWAPQFSMAEQGWRVIAPQLRGFDGGSTDSIATTVDDYAADVIDLLDALHVEDAVIGGLSMGGYVAFAMFRHAPRYFRGLVLADTRGQADAPEAVEGRKRLLERVRRDGPPAAVEEMLPKLVCESTREQRAEVVELIRGFILSNATEVIAGAILALMSRPDSMGLLRQIHCPTLVLVGDQDALTPPRFSEDMQRGIGGSELVVIPDAGHMSNMEQPAAFNAALARFLEHRV